MSPALISVISATSEQLQSLWREFIDSISYDPVICGNLQAERKELHHAAFIYFHEPAILRRKHQRWRMPEINEAKKAAWAHFAIKHSRDFPCIFFFTYSQCVAGGDR